MIEPKNKYIRNRLKKIRNIHNYILINKILNRSRIKKIKKEKTLKKHILKKWNKSATKIQKIFRCFKCCINYRIKYNKFINKTNFLVFVEISICFCQKVFF